MRGPTRARRLVAIVGATCAVLATWAPAARAEGAVSRALRAADAPVAQLAPVNTVALPGETTVRRYQQEVGGVPVLGAQVVVANAPDEPPLIAADASRVAVAAPSEARVPRARALALARAAGSVLTLRAAPSAELVIVPGDGGTLAWRVVVPASKPLADLEVLVDAVTGDVLSQRDLLQRRTAEAKIFDPNPAAEQNSDAGLADNGDADSALLRSLRRARTLKRIAAHQRCLKGRYVEALVHASGRSVCRRSLNWRPITRSRDAFEALMAYYHVDRTQTYFHRLGFTHVNNRRQVVLVDALKGDQSFYSPATRKITYGSGKVDDAEDADVIIHEYGHAVQDSQVPGFGTSFDAGAIGEGFGDYLTATATYRSPGLPAPGRAAACIFDWDGFGWGKKRPSLGSPTLTCGRPANDSRALLQAQLFCGLEIHCVGQVWASALLDLRAALPPDGQGRAVIDRDLIASQFMYVPGESFRAAVSALVTADKALYGGSHVAAICAEMEGQRGINTSSCP